VVIAIAFAPTITWWSGPLTSPWSEKISFAEALWMHLSHDYDHMEGMALFALPSLAAAASFLVPIDRGRLRPAIAIGTLVIGAWELFLVLVHAHGYGTPYYVTAQFFGIQAMIPEDEYLMHASVIAAAGAAMVAIEPLHRARTTPRA
jgi:hypothetical protein